MKKILLIALTLITSVVLASIDEGGIPKRNLNTIILYKTKIATHTVYMTATPTYEIATPTADVATPTSDIGDQQ